jgi:hypothetical protein
MFGKNVLTRIFELRQEEVRGFWRKFCVQELYNLAPNHILLW